MYTDDLPFVPQDERSCKHERSEVIVAFESSRYEIFYSQISPTMKTFSFKNLLILPLLALVGAAFF
jgi:hypothetical protein